MGTDDAPDELAESTPTVSGRYLRQWRMRGVETFEYFDEKLNSVVVQRAPIVGLSKLTSAIVGLGYDLDVLEANYLLERGLRGEEAMRAFGGSEAEVVKEVTESWLTICKRLAVSPTDETKGVKDLARIFERVRDDLRQLLTSLPPVPAPPDHTRLAKIGAVDSRVTTEDDSESIIDGKTEVTKKVAGRYLQCSEDHVLRLARQRNIQASATRPKKFNSASLRKYKYPSAQK